VPSVPTPKFTVAASEAFLTLLKNHDIPVEEVQYRQLSKAEPPVTAVKQFWTDHLSKAKSPDVDDATREKLLKGIDDLAKEHSPAPVADAGKATLRAETKIIDNVATFKASLPLGPTAVPMEQN